MHTGGGKEGGGGKGGVLAEHELHNGSRRDDPISPGTLIPVEGRRIGKY